MGRRPQLVNLRSERGCRYCYDMVGGEGGPALGRNGSPVALANVVEYSVPKTITDETKIDAGVWWDVLDTYGGWKLERNIVTGHCRIISSERKRAAGGPEASCGPAGGK